jgi:hypothetical protein
LTGTVEQREGTFDIDGVAFPWVGDRPLNVNDCGFVENLVDTRYSLVESSRIIDITFD